MEVEERVTEEELAAITAALLMMDEPGQPLAAFRVREVWPNPSPWRWAPVG